MNLYVKEGIANAILYIKNAYLVYPDKRHAWRLSYYVKVHLALADMAVSVYMWEGGYQKMLVDEDGHAFVPFPEPER